jgi:uncharacterized membrane protein
MGTIGEGILPNIIEIIELISSAILIWGFGKTFYKFLEVEWKVLNKKAENQQILHLRSHIGTYILLGLDFYIVSDILNSMLNPTSEKLLNLGIIVVLRTTIGYFLGKEITEIENSKEKLL